MKSHEWTFVPALPQLDIHTLSEDWALAASLEAHWIILARSMGKKPSEWIDSQGDRMYGAVIWLATKFDLADTIREDDLVTARCDIQSVRKPHALSVTRYSVDGKVKAEVSLLTSFIKRTERGSNKKFAKTRELWTEDDFADALVDDLLERHHQMKDEPECEQVALRTEVNRIRDFNTADFLYFKNFVRFAKAAEWAYGRSKPTRLNAERECFFYGNVSDGDVVETRVREDEPGHLIGAHHAPDGRRIFLSRARMQGVDIAVR